MRVIETVGAPAEVFGDWRPARGVFGIDTLLAEMSLVATSGACRSPGTAWLG
jgi:hypothetical protein